MALPSPCVGVCKLDVATGFCLGCGRSAKEVSRWPSLSKANRDAISSILPERLDKLQVRVRLLPWTHHEISAWISETISGARGTWVTGPPGAIAEFPCAPDREIRLQDDDGTITAHAPDAALRLRVNESLRAFAFSDGPIVLGLPKDRAILPSYSAFSFLGRDADAIDDADREDRLFDVGVGRQCARFCVRTGDKELLSLLSVHTGSHWSRVMPVIGPKLITASPIRVVESAAARIEVSAAIPSSDEASPEGAHTHFLPAIIKSGAEAPAKLRVPDCALPVAIFYPAKHYADRKTQIPERSE